MPFEQWFLLLLLGCLLAGFAISRWRYDLVAMAGLLIGVIAGLVPGDQAFVGFGHPAVVTVIAVLILSHALNLTGASDAVVRFLPTGQGTTVHVSTLTGVGALLSTVMNNVGALALMLPVTVKSGSTAKRAVSLLLMPLAFGSILGGLVTLIGTPPNIIVSAYRDSAMGGGFTMFDFAPVGLVCAAAGVAFIGLVGWRLIPIRRRTSDTTASYEIDDYLAEMEVPEESTAAGLSLKEIEEDVNGIEVRVVALVRDGRRFPAAPRFTRVRAGDILLVEASPQDLQKLQTRFNLAIAPEAEDRQKTALLRSDDIQVVEAVLAAGTPLENRTPALARLWQNYGVNLLAVARQNRAYRGRLSRLRFQPGDVLLLQGDKDRMPTVLSTLGALPLQSRDLDFSQTRAALITSLVFGGAIVCATLGLLPIAISLMTAVALLVMLRILSLRQVYEAVDWQVVVLLGALLPLGTALETTGTAERLAVGLLDVMGDASPALVLTVLMVITMLLTNLLNNAATALVMAPLAIDIAQRMEVSADPFLMAAAVGASCAFMTPIGHQNNTLVMGPGGYAFGDYWRMGLPLQLIVLAVSIPMILLVWPF